MKTVLVLLFMTIGLLYIGCGSGATAADWYVDNGANGANNGTSWTHAWESFSSTNWSVVSPGDTLYISGGYDS